VREQPRFSLRGVGIMRLNRGLRVSAVVSSVSVLLTGCVTAEQAAIYSDRAAGFSAVSAQASVVTKGKQSVWIQNQEQAQETATRVHALIHKKKIEPPRDCRRLVGLS
jgi:hypothetical protein